MCFSLIFIAIHSIIFLSQPDLDQIITNFLYSLVHSIVNLNKNRGEAEHKKHGKILKTHLNVFPCFLWMFIRGPWILLGKRPETIYKMHTEIRNSFSCRGGFQHFFKKLQNFLKISTGNNYLFFRTNFSLCRGFYVIECFNVDWMRLDLGKLGWSLAEAVFDVYRDVYSLYCCAVKCHCPGVA